MVLQIKSLSSHSTKMEETEEECSSKEVITEKQLLQPEGRAKPWEEAFKMSLNQYVCSSEIAEHKKQNQNCKLTRKRRQRITGCIGLI